MEPTVQQSSAIYFKRHKGSKSRSFGTFRRSFTLPEELRFSGGFALHSQIRPTMLNSRWSATHTSRKRFDQDNCR
jgi:hypothetical protein